MRKTLLNRILSVMLTILLVLSVISIAPETANAADRTDDFISFPVGNWEYIPDNFEWDVRTNEYISFTVTLNSLKADDSYSAISNSKFALEYYEDGSWFSIPYQSGIADKESYVTYIDNANNVDGIIFDQPLSAFDFTFKSGRYRVSVDVTIHGIRLLDGSYSHEEKKSLSAEFNLIVKPETVVPTSVTYPPFSFANSATVGSANDGIDFNALNGNYIYLGSYKHLTNYEAGRTGSTGSSYSYMNPIYENVARPVLWQIAGEERMDGKLTAVSAYMLDIHQFHNKASWLSWDYTKSDIRKWLNGSFFNTIFQPSESNIIAPVDVTVAMWYDGVKQTGDFTAVWGRDNPSAHTQSWPQTAKGDKIYLPGSGGWEAGDSGDSKYSMGRLIDDYYSDHTWTFQNGSLETAAQSGIGILRGSNPLMNYSFEVSISREKDGNYHWRDPDAYSSNHILPGNYTSSKFGVRPIIKLIPSEIVYAAELNANPAIGQAQSDGSNYPVYESDIPGINSSFTKLTILSDSVSLSSLSKSSGEVLKNGDTLTFLKSNSMIALKGAGKNHTKLAYKIVGMNDGKRTIVGYGEGTATDLNILTDSLSDSETYTLYVWAQKDNAINSHEASNPMYFNLQSGLPAPPKAESTEVGILIRWTGEDDATGYRIYRSETAGEKGEMIYESGPTPTEYVDVNVKSNTTYYYTVYKLVAGQEAALTFDQSAGAGSATEVTTGIIKGEEKEGEKGFLLMTVDSPVMSVNGVETEIDPGRGTAPKIVDGRTLMPIRAAMEAMGGSVEWSDAERKVSLSNAENIIEMWISERMFTVNGVSKELDVPPQISNGRTMLPIKFVAENIGCEIAWVGSTREIIVVYWENQK